MSCASGLLAPISEQPHSSIETATSDALVITTIFAPITAQPATGRVVFVTRITSGNAVPVGARKNGVFGAAPEAADAARCVQHLMRMQPTKGSIIGRSKAAAACATPIYPQQQGDFS
jgi:hypothetical protein